MEKYDLRITYIKNGDAVDQAARISSNIKHRIENGPDAFIYDFILNNINSSILVLSIAERSEKFKSGKIKAIVYNSGRGKPLAIFLRLFSTIRMFFSALMFRPDRIICGCTGEQLWIAFLTACLLKIPIVHSRHNLIVTGKKNFVKRNFYKIDEWIIRRLNGVIAHGPFLQDQIKKLRVKSGRIFEFDVGFSDTVSVFDEKEPFVDSESAFNDSRYLLYVGRVEKNKGIFDLLFAAKPALLSNPDLKLIYVGDGNDLNRLKLNVIEHGLEEKVMTIGRKDRSNTLRIINSSYLLICPTQSGFPEGRCMVAMEGLVMGVPVVAPNFGPFPYLVKENENGLLYKADSTEELSQCIDELVSNHQKYRKLRIGAIKSGQDIVKPIRTFNQALELAFKKSS